jgi:sugar lactone lactonase YvrE
MHRHRLALTAAALTLLVMPAGRSAAHPASGIAVDDRGVVYFADTGCGVWRIESDGKLTLVSGSAMHWMAIDRKGSFSRQPAEFGQWFGRLTPTGQAPALLSCSDFPFVVGNDGNLYYARMHGLAIHRRTPAGEESVLVPRERFGVGADRPVGVNGMACGPDGTIYVVSLDSLNKDVGSGDHAVYAVSPDGKVRTVAKEFVQDKPPQDQRHPEVRPQYCRGMAVGPDGAVYVAVTGSRRVMKISPKGEASTVLACAKPWTPTGVDMYRGEVYVLEYDDETPTEGRNWPPRVRKVGADGAVTVLAAVDRAMQPGAGR